MRIRFMIDPSARKRDLEEVTESYNLPEEGLKYLDWRNEYTVSNFFYTWNMVKDYFRTSLQVTSTITSRHIITRRRILPGYQQNSKTV